MTGNYLLLKLGRIALGGLLSVVMLGAVVDKVLSPKRSVVVHVTEADVELCIDDSSYPIRGKSFDPLEFLLPPGTHRIAMFRGDETLLDRRFVVERDSDLVLTACPEP